MTTALCERLVASYGRMTPPDRAWLIRRSVSNRFLTLGIWPGPVGFARIETHPLGIFDFAESGPRAFVHPIWSAGPYSEILDLVAWFPDRPDIWWTHLYTGLPLGVDQLDHAEIAGEPIILHPTPLSWLVAEGEGICILDWVMSAPALRSVPVLVCKDDSHGRELQRRLTEPRSRCPEIRVPIDGRAA